MIKNILGSLLLLAVATGSITVNAEEKKIDSAALLQVSKQMEKPAYMHNEDFDITYTVFNTGNKEATNIEIIEASFTKSENIDKKYSEKKFTIPKISPGQSASKTFTYTASTLGTYRPTMSKVAYNNGVTDVSGYTSKPRQFRILTSEDYDYEYGSRVLQWTVYFLTSAMMIVFPYAMYMGSSSRYSVPTAAPTVSKKRSKGKN